jgi:hypothetical protein
MSDEQDVECSFCHTVLDEDEQRTMDDGDIVCADCTLYCESCNTLMANADSINSNDNVYCSECAMYCENCNEATLHDDTYSVGRSRWCTGCRRKCTKWDCNCIFTGRKKYLVRTKDGTSFKCKRVAANICRAYNY